MWINLHCLDTIIAVAESGCRQNPSSSGSKGSRWRVVDGGLRVGYRRGMRNECIGGGGKEAGVAGTSPDVVSPECNGRPILQSHLSTIWSRRQQAVCVRHAFKHYGSNKNPNHVLENLNMTVAKGTM
uniref:Uncharacterized protein n=1 Tax=Timema tahoe TaxID=61484 RepID=A0A7R9IPZ5_9NEOP|nr:unnamed protein product [Timema tahoe]